jgi:hypothetical protein
MSFFTGDLAHLTDLVIASLMDITTGVQVDAGSTSTFFEHPTVATDELNSGPSIDMAFIPGALGFPRTEGYDNPAEVTLAHACQRRAATQSFTPWHINTNMEDDTSLAAFDKWLSDLSLERQGGSVDRVSTWPCSSLPRLTVLQYPGGDAANHNDLLAASTVGHHDTSAVPPPYVALGATLCMSFAQPPWCAPQTHKLSQPSRPFFHH